MPSCTRREVVRQCDRSGELQAGPGPAAGARDRSMEADYTAVDKFVMVAAHEPSAGSITNFVILV